MICVVLALSRPRFGSNRGGPPPPPKKFGNPGDRLRKKKWDLSELPKFEKNFYSEHTEIQRMSQVRKWHTAFFWFTYPFGIPSIYISNVSNCFFTPICFTVWDGRVSQEKRDHCQGLWVPEASTTLPSGTVSSWVTIISDTCRFTKELPTSSYTYHTSLKLIEITILIRSGFYIIYVQGKIQWLKQRHL